MLHPIAAVPTLAAFAVASLILAVTPGPGVVYIVTRTLAQGRRAGLASVAGVALGNLGNAVGASLGLAALFALSAAAFTLVRIAGAAYLVWLGIEALRASWTGPSPTHPGRDPADRRRIFRDGFAVALLNPKTALFFAAFLPQFIDPQGSAIAQSLGFGLVFVAIAASTDAVYVLAAGACLGRLSLGSGRRWAGPLAASAYFGLAAFTLCIGARPRPET